MGFYEDIAGQYDDIVDSAGRAGSARRLAGWLVESRRAGRVLDVACGTGLHARALAERGVRVVAADISAEMLARARQRDGDSAGLVEWVHSPMESVAEKVAGPFDAILCLGNSLPHLLTDRQLRQAVEGFRALLAADGCVLVQVLNYDRILGLRERVVGVTRRGDDEYVRFYDFLPGTVRFNVLELHWRGERCLHRLHQTELRPYRAGELAEAFAAAGFARPEMYDGPAFGAFDPEASDGLLLVARLSC